jgi:hypothetical protein
MSDSVEPDSNFSGVTQRVLGVTGVIDAGEASINVTSMFHLPPEGDVAIRH